MQWSGTFSFNQDKKYGATYDNYTFDLINKDPARTSMFNIELYKIIECNIRSRPNTGVLAIIDILNYDIETLYIKGYTLFKGGYDFEYRKQDEKKVLGKNPMVGQLPRLDKIAKFLSEKGSKFSRYEFSERTSGQPTVDECLSGLVRKILERIKAYNA